MFRARYFQRVPEAPSLERIYIGVDPLMTHQSTCFVVAAGIAQGRIFVLQSGKIIGSPATWGCEIAALHHTTQANGVVTEAYAGGNMVRDILHHINPDIAVVMLALARPSIYSLHALYQQERMFHVCHQVALEHELLTYEDDKHSKTKFIKPLCLVAEALLNPQPTMRIRSL